MTHLVIKKKNEVFINVESEPHVYMELSDHFSFDVPGAKFMPQYRNKYWDGKIRLFDSRKNELYTGLTDKVLSFCNKKGYTYDFEDGNGVGSWEANWNGNNSWAGDACSGWSCQSTTNYVEVVSSESYSGNKSLRLGKEQNNDFTSSIYSKNLIPSRS